jgi:hypothetical protein
MQWSDSGSDLSAVGAKYEREYKRTKMTAKPFDVRIGQIREVCIAIEVQSQLPQTVKLMVYAQSGEVTIRVSQPHCVVYGLLACTKFVF